MMEEIQPQVCPNCQRELTVECFHKTTKRLPFMSGWCKICKRKWYYLHPEFSYPTFHRWKWELTGSTLGEAGLI